MLDTGMASAKLKPYESDRGKSNPISDMMVLENANASFASQYMTMRAQKALDEHQNGTSSHPMDFSVKIPDSPASARAGGDYMFDPSAVENMSLEKLQTFDKDGDGRINHLEFRKLHKEAEKLVGESGTESTPLSQGPMNMEGFTDFLGAEYGDDLELSEAAIKAMFDKFDKDGDGVLNADELESAIKHIEEEIKKKVEQEVENKETLITTSYQLKAEAAAESAEPAKTSTSNANRSGAANLYEKSIEDAARWESEIENSRGKLAWVA